MSARYGLSRLLPPLTGFRCRRHSHEYPQYSTRAASFGVATDNRYELVDGALVPIPPESPENLSLARFFIIQLLQHIAL